MSRKHPRGLSEERYRLLVQSVTDYAIYMLDPDGHVVSWNSGAQRLKGYTESEIVGQHFSAFYLPEDVHAGLPARTLSIAEREGRFEAEAWRLRKGGERFYASIVVDPIRSPTGELLGFAKVTRDLTERRAAQEALRRSEEQFRLLVQGVTDYAIYMLDLSGVVTSWNAGAERIKGYTPKEVIGSHFSRFYRPEDRAAGVPERALRTAQVEGRFESEGWRIRKDGSSFWANVVIDPIHDTEGQHIGYAKVTRDVTEKRAAALELERAQQALFQSQKLDALGQLTGGIAHDFNNLLMVILSSHSLMKRRLPHDPKLHSLLDNATQGARRGVELTKRLLAFARRQELAPRRVDVASLIEGMKGMLEHTVGASIALTLAFEESLDPVHIDPHQLELAVLNLAVNARDAMPNGGTLRIEANKATSDHRGNHLPPTACVCLRVSDSGLGMDADTLGHAMEPFFTTKGIGKGTGLGLPMVHGLAAQSNGHFSIRSVQGQGTTAELWLPIAAPGPDAIEPVRPTADTAAVPGSPLKTSRLVVLAVDDDVLVLNGTAAMLEESGHRPVLATSAAQALQILGGSAQIDVVLTDHLMPGMTGADLADAIGTLRPGLPVVLASGYAELPPERQAGERRLAKPFSQEELAAALAAAIVRPH